MGEGFLFYHMFWNKFFWAQQNLGHKKIWG